MDVVCSENAEIDVLTNLTSQLGINRTYTSATLLLGNFKCIDLKKKNTGQKALTKYLVTDKGYTQLI